MYVTLIFCQLSGWQTREIGPNYSQEKSIRMLAVVSLDYIVPRETQMVNAMFDRGLDIFHIRKKNVSDSDIDQYIHQIDPIHRDKLAVHLVQEMTVPKNIKRLHFPSALRHTLKDREQQGWILSTSTHSINEFNSLSASWSYSFLSPVYPSISKPGYGMSTRVLNELSAREHAETKLIALGGITLENLQTVCDQGADGAALSGAVWFSDKPVEYVEASIKLFRHIKSHRHDRTK